MMADEEQPVDGEGGGQRSVSSTAAGDSATKISCLACRAAKRKCSTAGVTAVCQRCRSQSLLCEYKKHNRGRKKQLPPPSDPAASSSQASTSAVPLLSSNNTPSLNIPHAPSQSTSASFAPPPNQPPSSAATAPPPHQTQVEGTSIRQVSFSHVIPNEGDSSPYLAGSSNMAPQGAQGPSFDLLRVECPDAVQAGLLTAAEASELFASYYEHLNIFLPVLDPTLHTPSYCTETSPLLFTSILAVTSKIVRPRIYSSCLVLANKLFAQAVEYGLCSIEVVQATILLTHFKKAEDSTSWRRTGYAIRMAQELGLHKKRKGGLSAEEREARHVLNSERTWLNLIVADYHLAIHHSLPRMITDDDEDYLSWSWTEGEAHLFCAGDAILAPWIAFSRMCRLFSDMLSAMDGDPSNLRLLSWLDHEWKRWKTRWLNREDDRLRPQHVSTLRLCDAFFRFHLAEYRLLFIVRYGSEGRSLDTSQPTALSFAFGECADAALGVATVFQSDFSLPGYLASCFNLAWVALAVCSVWLVKNIAAMEDSERTRTIGVLSAVQASIESVASPAEDMITYMHRLLKRLLDNISLSWQLPHLSPNSQPTPLRQHPPSSNAAPPTFNLDAFNFNTLNVPAPWDTSTAQDTIRDELWFSQLPTLPSLREVPRPSPQAGPSSSQIQPHSSGDTEPNHQQLPMFFPPNDDDFWKLVFPAVV
ncbi:hypothetical protein BCR35DRAFT_281551 [Leucosporidium creatinivorum]|uniref:Zn(2)-C6 fungal-type domain-containing protein n=1 Tax=Leucosporidium creatinivorum TaxID=106004 RepID=A0A1Y2EPZ7_9BASI|nr:hypothetical protein BCR35DRAFT_281551 [Leucosporidium creatinivorum]